jgi:uncharacterized protein (TIGR04141 family)
VFHHLTDTAYEYDFGLRVTLNSLDPHELKSADMVAPGVARRKRTQVPISTELTYLDFDGNSEIIKSLTGKVKKEYQNLFRNATGSVSLKVTLALERSQLSATCKTLLELYEKDDYKTVFPNIQNIAPVRDPATIAALDEMLLDSFRQGDGSVTLTIPDIVDYRGNTCCVFQAEGRSSQIFPDISLDEFYEFLGGDFDLAALNLDQLKAYRMMLTDVDGKPDASYSIYRALIFDAEPAGEQVIYHLCEGSWYSAAKNYVERLTHYLDRKCEDTDLCPYNHDGTKDGKAVYDEGRYNAAIPEWSGRFICLDETDISPDGNTQMEPCDIYTVVGDASAVSGYRAILYHLKISTRSAHLSHLFNQGANSIDLIQIEEASQQKIKQLVRERLNGNDDVTYLAPIDSFDFKMIFGVITHKDINQKSGNLLLFSRISLMRNMQQLDLRKVPSALTFIDDRSPKKHGHQKYTEVIAEVYNLEDGGVEVRPVPGQEFDPGESIKRCPRPVRESAAGTRYKLSVRKSDGGRLSTFHGWPFELVA